MTAAKCTYLIKYLLYNSSMYLVTYLAGYLGPGVVSTGKNKREKTFGLCATDCAESAKVWIAIFSCMFVLLFFFSARVEFAALTMAGFEVSRHKNQFSWFLPVIYIPNNVIHVVCRVGGFLQIAKE